MFGMVYIKCVVIRTVDTTINGTENVFVYITLTMQFMFDPVRCSVWLVGFRAIYMSGTSVFVFCCEVHFFGMYFVYHKKFFFCSERRETPFC